MSRDVYDDGRLIVTIYAGPASMGNDRRMVQVNLDSGYIAISLPEFVELVDKLKALIGEELARKPLQSENQCD